MSFTYKTELLFYLFQLKCNICKRTLSQPHSLGLLVFKYGAGTPSPQPGVPFGKFRKPPRESADEFVRLHAAERGKAGRLEMFGALFHSPVVYIADRWRHHWRAHLKKDNNKLWQSSFLNNFLRSVLHQLVKLAFDVFFTTIHFAANKDWFAD